MPNGKTITLQSSPRCPADASKWTTLDGSDITPASAPKPVPPTSTGLKKGETYVVRPKPVAAETNPMDTALQLCAALKKTTNAWCSVAAANGRFQAFSTIKVWDNITTSEEAYSTCRTLASTAHDFSGGSMRKGYRQVQVFSKHGATSALATCNV